MLILGGRYGTIEPESGKSYTHLEYEFALENDIPVFAIVLNEQYLANKKSKDVKLKVYEHEVENPHIEKYTSFKELVTSKMVRFVGDINQISTEVALSLQHFVEKDGKEYHFRGWIRGTDVEQFQNRKVSSKLFEMDEILLNKVIKIIEERNLIYNIEYIASYCSYTSEMTESLYELIYFSQAPSNRFFNNDIQQLFIKLIKKLGDFTDFLVANFFPIGITDRYCLYPDLKEDQEGRDRYDKYVRELSKISGETIEEIREFVHEARIILYSSETSFKKVN